MNKLEILIQGRLEDLKLSTESQHWKTLAYIDTSGGKDSSCWSIGEDYEKKGNAVLEFAKKLVGEAFVKRSREVVLRDPRVTEGLATWHDAYIKAKETKAEWLIDTGSRAEEEA